jgi:hypothetical protein
LGEKVRATFEEATAGLAAISDSGLCDDRSAGDDDPRTAEQAAKDAADRLAQSAALREKVADWGDDAPSDLEKARGTVTKKQPPSGADPDLEKARGSLTKAAPTQKKPVPETKTGKTVAGKTPPKGKKPVEDPPPEPSQPEPEPKTAPDEKPEEEPKELQPFYVVFDMHLLMPPEAKDPLSVPVEKWTAQKMTRIACRVSGRALEDFVAEAQKGRPKTEIEPITEEKLFERGGFYFQDIGIRMGKESMSLILLYKCVGISKTAEGLRPFGAFEQPPAALKGNKGLPNMHIDMSGSEGGFTIANLGGMRVEGTTLRKDAGAQGAWSRNVQVRAAAAMKPLLQAIMSIGEAIGDAIPTIE